MTSIDYRKNYYLTLDTETQGNLDFALPYDLGGAIHDKKGNIIETFSFVIKETFIDRYKKMQSSYFAEKIPQYIEDLANGKRELVSIIYAYHYVNELIEKYHVKAICAYNHRFDYNCLNNLLRLATGGEFYYFYPQDIEIWDTWKMAKQTICQQKSYIYFCEKHGFKTNHKKPQLQTKAETVFRYMTWDKDYEEEHTGLADVMIEVAIFARCMRQNKPMKKLLFEPKA